MRSMRFVLVASAAIFIAASGGARAQQSQADLAKAAQNPVSAMISVPFRNNTFFGVGAHDDTANVLNIQPVVPVKLGEWNIINRFIARDIGGVSRRNVLLTGSSLVAASTLISAAWIAPAQALQTQPQGATTQPRDSAGDPIIFDGIDLSESLLGTGPGKRDSFIYFNDQAFGGLRVKNYKALFTIGLYINPPLIQFFEEMKTHPNIPYKPFGAGMGRIIPSDFT